MKRRLILIAALISCSACTTGRDVVEAPGAFERAARSWEGAPVDEMITVWGQPSQFTDEHAKDGEGIAHWRSGGRGAFGASQSNSGRCAVDVWFAQDRIIRRVEVSGRGCDERYAERLDGLSR